MGDNLLKTVVTQYAGVKVHPKNQTRGDRFQVIKHYCEERELELGVTAPVSI